MKAPSADELRALEEVCGLAQNVLNTWRQSDVLPAALLLAAVVASRALYEMPERERRELLLATLVELDALVESGLVRVDFSAPRGAP